MGAKERLRNHFWANSAYDPEADSDAKWADDTLAEVESEARAQVYESVLRGLRSEEQTTQVRAIIASVENDRDRGQHGS